MKHLSFVACAALAAACSSSSSSGSAPEHDAGASGDASTGERDGGDDGHATQDGPAADSAQGGDALEGGGAVEDSPHEGAASEGGAGGLPYMVGIKTNGDANGPAKVEAWLGRPLDLAGTTITTTSYIGAGAPYVNGSGGHPLLEVSFPLLSIFGETNGLADLAQAASGAYDTTYEAMAQALAAWPNPLLSARIGWEFNGNWYAWSNGVGTNATYANYVSAFQHAAKAVKKYNPKALIQWCVAWGQPDPTPYWPGAYDATTNPGGVDVVSIDFYQANISQYNNGGKQSSWAMAQSTGTIDLDWVVSFAQSKGVKVALSEYGAGSPSSKGEGSGAGLDDGAWTAASIAWMQSLPAGLFLWTSWSDDAPADDIVTAGANPAEQAAWSTAWNGTHFGGAWWP
ncbi:MAG TPA: hypothetical protein VGG39_20345 [Polyangiaceae bacterium]